MRRFFLHPATGFILIYFAAAGLRIAYLADFASLPVFGQVVGPDVSEYFAEAQKIRAGQWLPQEVMIHAPLYPYLLAFFLAVSGGDLFLTRMLQSLFCALLILLPVFWMLHKRVAGLSSPLRFLPYAAALMIGLYPPLVICNGDFFSENLMIVLLLFSLWCFTLHIRCGDGLAGLFGGLAMLAHPGCVFYLPFAAVYSFFRLRRCGRYDRFCFLRAGSFLLGVFLLIAPVCLRNSLLVHRPVLIQDNSMFNLVLGNSPSASGTCRIPPGRRWEHEFEKANKQAESQKISIESYYRNQFFRYVITRPLHYVKMLLKKGAMSVSAREFTTWSDVVSLELIYWHKYLHQNWFFILLLLGGPALLVGLSLRSFRRFMQLELVLFASVFAGQVFFLTAGRYRMPLVIPLAVFAGYFLCRPKPFLGTVPRSAGMLIALAALFMIGSYPYAIPRQMEKDYARSLLASAWIRAGKPVEAVKIYRDPVAGECFPDRKLTILGQAWYALGDLKRSGEYYHESIRQYPRQPEGYLNYASVLADTGRFADAEKCLAKALQLRPKGSVLADIQYNLGEIAQRTRRIEKAQHHYLAALSVQPSHRRALNNLGTVYIQRKEAEKAISLFRRAVRLEPDNMRLKVNLAVSLAMSGNESGAKKLLEEILRQDPTCVPAQKLLKMLP
ncbi:MAG: tetratricopeptide repeat protein [Lentisphaeria bacterium]|nr:tetratricopeptide repeat protein [Lentisphaeria bacterium]